MVGSLFDLDAVQVLPVGNLSLLTPHTSEDRQRAYKLRRPWVIWLQQIARNPVPLERAQMILNQLQNFFNNSILEKVSDEAFSL